jgi:hypothetical protein
VVGPDVEHGLAGDPHPLSLLSIYQASYWDTPSLFAMELRLAQLSVTDMVRILLSSYVKNSMSAPASAL